MDSNKWRRELDRLSEMKSMLVILNPALEEQTSRQVRGLYDIFAELSRLEKELKDAGFIKRRKVSSQVEDAEKNLDEEFMRIVRDFGELLRKEHRRTLSTRERLQSYKPAETKKLLAMSMPSIGAGDLKDFKSLYDFTKNISDLYKTLHKELASEAKDLLDENKRIVETYERHVTIDRGEVSTTISTENLVGLAIADLMVLMEKLHNERVYLDGRKDEVSRMLSASLMSDIDSLQASVDTATKLGLDLPMDFSQKIRVLARDASQAENLTSLMSLESQLHSLRLQMANILQDRIINSKHEVTSSIVEGGIPTSSDLIPQPPAVSAEDQDVPSLLSSYQKMVEWESQVRIALKNKVEETLDEVEKATDFPEDTGIDDIVSVRQFVADSKAELQNAEIDDMISIYVNASKRQEIYRKNLIEEIREYMTRFNELATSADRVLDYAQLSKKAPKVEDLEGGVIYLHQSLVNLRNTVESGVATFREACEQEIDAIIQDLQTIKPAYAEIFMPLIVELDEGKVGIEKLDEFSAIRSEMRTIKDSILADAKDALENLRYRLGVKIRLAAAKLMGAGVEMPPEVQEAISELNNIGVVADTVFSLPAKARKMVEIYEKKITGKVIEKLNEEIDKLTKSFERASLVGVDLEEELAILYNLQENTPSELEDAADAFDKLSALTTSEAIQAKIIERANEAHRQIKDAVSIFEEQGMPDFVKRLKALLEKVPETLEQESKYVTEALEVCLTLANIQDEMLGVIKDIAKKDKEEYEKRIEQKSKYYSTIVRVYEKHPKEFSKHIFPMTKMLSIEESLSEEERLDKALEYYNDLEKMKENWIDKAEKMDGWHKTLRMFMSGFSAAASADERAKFMEDAKRKIKETYSREDISTYLTWALEEIVQTMMDKRG